MKYGLKAYLSKDLRRGLVRRPFLAPKPLVAARSGGRPPLIIFHVKLGTGRERVEDYAREGVATRKRCDEYTR